MNLNEALTQIAAAGNLNADELIAYAAEDTIGGRDQGYWQAMGIHEDEGKVMYALVRALKPKQCVEIGVAEGCSSAHILSALNTNGGGKLYSVDIATDGVGGKVPEYLRERWTLITGQDALTVKLPKKAEFILEDASHKFDFTRDMYKRLITLNPKVLLTHDFYTHFVYPDFEVEKAFVEVFGKSQGILIDGAFTGIGYWFPDQE